MDGRNSTGISRYTRYTEIMYLEHPFLVKGCDKYIVKGGVMKVSGYISKDDVGKKIIKYKCDRCFNEHNIHVGDAIGYIMYHDVGKKWVFENNVFQMENDEQLENRRII